MFKIPKFRPKLQPSSVANEENIYKERKVYKKCKFELIKSCPLVLNSNTGVENE